LHQQARAAGWNAADLAGLLRAHAAIVPLFAGWRRASGRCFTNHLAGTASLVLEFSGGVDDVLAALVHAVFDEGAFGRAGGRHREKAQASLSRSVPAAAADLAARYSSFRWPRFVAAAEADAASAVQDADAPIIRLRIANEIDDALDWPFFTEASRASGMRELAISEKIARALRWQAMAARAAFVAGEMAKTPPAEANPRDAAYFVPPHGYELSLCGRLRSRIQRVLRMANGRS
jgi:hypothetical protein